MDAVHYFINHIPIEQDESEEEKKLDEDDEDTEFVASHKMNATSLMEDGERSSKFMIDAKIESSKNTEPSGMSSYFCFLRLHP